MLYDKTRYPINLEVFLPSGFI